jgi:hypothetical protein
MTEKFDYTIAPTYKSYYNFNQKRFPKEKTISEEQYNLFRNANCFYCDKSSPNGIDRINKAKGYNFKNCVSCCKQCMLLKSNLTEREFKVWAKRFVKKQMEVYLQKLK